jgi:hypothetical protein
MLTIVVSGFSRTMCQVGAFNTSAFCLKAETTRPIVLSPERRKLCDRANPTAGGVDGLVHGVRDHAHRDERAPAA